MTMMLPDLTAVQSTGPGIASEHWDKKVAVLLPTTVSKSPDIVISTLEELDPPDPGGAGGAGGGSGSGWQALGHSSEQASGHQYAADPYFLLVVMHGLGVIVADIAAYVRSHPVVKAVSTSDETLSIPRVSSALSKAPLASR